MLAIAIGLGGLLAEVAGPVEELVLSSPIVSVQVVDGVIGDMCQTSDGFHGQSQGTGPGLLQPVEQVALFGGEVTQGAVGIAV